MCSAAHPDTANPPAIAVPETLPLPDAAAVIVVSDVGGATTIIAIAWAIIARAVIISGASERTADDGAANHAGSETSAKTALRVGRSGRRNGRNSQGGDGGQRHQ